MTTFPIETHSMVYSKQEHFYKPTRLNGSVL